MAILTEKNMEIHLPKLFQAIVTKAAQDDIVVFPHSTLLPNAVVAITGVQEALERPVIVAAATIAAGVTSLAYDGATASTRPSGGYYLLTTGGEIIYVTTDSGYSGTSGTVSLVRGALGTTAAQITDNDVLYLLCGVVLSSASTGLILIDYIALPDNPGAGGFA